MPKTFPAFVSSLITRNAFASGNFIFGSVQKMKNAWKLIINLEYLFKGGKRQKYVPDFLSTFRDNEQSDELIYDHSDPLH